MPVPRGRRPIGIGIVGSRRRTSPNDFALLYRAFRRVYKVGDRIVSGGCKTGADAWAERLAREVGVEPILYRPNFQVDAFPQCYFIRNSLIARDADVLLAVVAPDRTGGTEDTVRKALALKRLVCLIEGETSGILSCPDEVLEKALQNLRGAALR